MEESGVLWIDWCFCVFAAKSKTAQWLLQSAAAWREHSHSLYKWN